MFTTPFAQVRNFRRVDGKPEVQTIVKRGTERKSEKEESAEGIRAGGFQSPIGYNKSAKVVVLLGMTPISSVRSYKTIPSPN